MRDPDLRAIERALAAENARIGAEEANKYPQLSLGLTLGLLSLATGNFATAASAVSAGESTVRIRSPRNVSSATHSPPTVMKRDVKPELI